MRYRYIITSGKPSPDRTLTPIVSVTRSLDRAHQTARRCAERTPFTTFVVIDTETMKEISSYCWNRAAKK